MENRIHDAKAEDFPVRGGDDAIRLEELVNSGQSLHQDTFALHRDVVLKKTMKATDCVFKSKVSGVRHTIICEGRDNELLRTLSFGIDMVGQFKSRHLVLFNHQ